MGPFKSVFFSFIFFYFLYFILMSSDTFLALGSVISHYKFTTFNNCFTWFPECRNFAERHSFRNVSGDFWHYLRDSKLAEITVFNIYLHIHILLEKVRYGVVQGKNGCRKITSFCTYISLSISISLLCWVKLGNIFKCCY